MDAAGDNNICPSSVGLFVSPLKIKLLRRRERGPYIKDVRTGRGSPKADIVREVASI